MRRLVIGNTEYTLRAIFKENGKKMISILRNIQENPYCWDSTFYVVSMSWRRYKKSIKEVNNENI